MYENLPSGHDTGDITLLSGNSGFATENFDGPIPFNRVRDLFDFTVQFTPVYTRQGGEFVEVPRRIALERTDNGRVLNVVSKKYGIHQFGEVLIDNLLTLTSASSTDLDILGAGLLQNGAVGWVQVQAPTVEVAGDEIAPTITLASSHNGTLATSYRVGMHRFACSNQIASLRRRMDNVYKIRHTLNSRMQFGQAREVLGLMFKESEEFAAEVATLINTSVSDAQWVTIMNRMMPRPTGENVAPAAITRWENRWDAISKLYREDERVAPYRGTAWGAVQAFSTYRQWERPFRSTGTNGDTTRMGRQMHDFLSGKLNASDQKAYGVVRQVVGV